MIRFIDQPVPAHPGASASAGVLKTDGFRDFRLARRVPLAVALLLLFFGFGAPKLSAWVYHEFALDSDARIAMIAKAGIFNPYLEVRGKLHLTEGVFRYHSLSAGSYVKVTPWLKLGAFYRLQGGERHLEDWTFDPGPPDSHGFNPVAGRYEHLIYFDATPRFLLPQMPGRNWVMPIKLRWYYNFRNSHHTVHIRPGLTYVMMRDREPLLNLTVNYNVYLALNFNDSLPIYAHGPYFQALWHVNEWFKLEGRLEYQWKFYNVDSDPTWSQSWLLNSHHLVVGFGVVFTPDFDRL